MSGILKLLNVFLLSSIKFVISPAYSFFLGLNYWETILLTSIGGIFGFFFFYLLTKFIIYEFHQLKQLVYCYIPTTLINSIKRLKPAYRDRRAKKIFTRRNRMIVQIKNQYGMLGLIILTPVLLSIPFGAFLSYKYYGRRKKLIPLMMAAIISWAVVISTFYSLIPVHS